MSIDMSHLEQSSYAFAEIFCPVRAVEQPVAITIAVREAIVAAGGLDRLCGLVLPHQAHHLFGTATREYVDVVERQALDNEVATRPLGGSVQHALGDMCVRGSIEFQELVDMTQTTQVMVAPIVFWSRYMDRHMASNDLTVYYFPK